MPQLSKKNAPDTTAGPAKQASPDTAPNLGVEEFIERAGRSYFEACQRMARAINRLKGRREKR